MKKKLILFLLLTISTTIHARVIDVDTLIIRFFTWEVVDVPHLITCINYETEVPYKEYVVTDTSAINTINEKIKDLHSTQEQDFCVACKLLCIKNGTISDIICLNKDYIMIDGKVFSCDRSIVNIIDTLINKIPPSKEKFSYKPEKFGAEYCKGKEELNKLLSSYYNKIKKEYKIKGITKFEILCKANKKGYTKTVKVKLYNKDISSTDKHKIENNITEWFKRKIKWKKNNTRMNADWINIYFKSPDDL